jgi:siroheme synthase-like protein
MAPRFPLFVNIENASCLVIGGGDVATRRVQTLRKCGARVRVVSPAFSEALVAWAAAEGDDSDLLELSAREFKDADILGVRLVFACTDSSDVNRRVAVLAAQHNVMCNISDDPQASNFHFPGLVTRGELSVGINTNGGSPSVSRQVRELVEMMLPEDFGDRIQSVGRTPGETE